MITLSEAFRITVFDVSPPKPEGSRENKETNDVFEQDDDQKYEYLGSNKSDTKWPKYEN